jgi:hypothetical protein
MVKPISLRLRHTQAIDQAYTNLINAGRGEEAKRIRAARTMRQARANVARAREQARLKRCAVLAAHKAIVAVKAAYEAQHKLADEFDRERWLGLREFVVSELMRIVEGKRPLD